MDPAHGPYVHQNWWWRSSSHQLEKAKRFEPRPLGFAMASHAPSRNSYAYKVLGGAPVTEITFRLPGFRWEHITVGPRQVLALTCLTPLSDTRTRITQIFWSDHWAFTLIRPDHPHGQPPLPEAGRRHGEPAEPGPALRPAAACGSTTPTARPSGTRR